jgi:5-methyltetrahydrofolate--homocysteine methyltransferase
METILKSAQRTVIIAPDKPTVLIGERINPTGRRHLAAALKEGNLDIVRREAETQVEAGADVLDVNVGVAGLDELVLLPEALRRVMSTVDVPVCIDSANAEALRAALIVHQELAPGAKPLINSVNGDEVSLERVLPLVAEYGAAVIGLTMDKQGIPPAPEQRLAIAHKIVEKAVAFGIPREDVIIDCLTLTVGADAQSGLTALKAIRLVREELGVNMTLGASNISFGLPEREVINQAFLPMAILSGVNCPIVDAAKARPVVLATDLVLGRDNYARRYILDYKKRRQRGG